MNKIIEEIEVTREMEYVGGLAIEEGSECPIARFDAENAYRAM